MEGTTIGEWKILKLVRLPVKGRLTGRPFYLCECKCGRQRLKNRSKLIHTNIIACSDCRRNDPKRRSPYNPRRSTMIILNGIKARCWYPRVKNYKNYGARGIQLCERWYSFENFVKDMGYRPEGLQLDRIDNDGNYEPGNCRWVTSKVNCNNRSRRKKI